MTFKAHPTRYQETLFRSRLEARWAAWADRLGWDWTYEPVDLNGWTPDFLFRVPCMACAEPLELKDGSLKRGEDGHWVQEKTTHWIPGSHQLYAEVKPYSSMDQFARHPVMRRDRRQAPHPAMFGVDPTVSRWWIFCGGELHQYDAEYWCSEHNGRSARGAWEYAGNQTRYRRPSLYDLGYH